MIVNNIKSLTKKVWRWLTNRWTVYIALAVWLLFFNTVSALLAFTDYLTQPLDVFEFCLVMLIYIGLSLLWGYFIPHFEAGFAHDRAVAHRKLTHILNDIKLSSEQLEKAHRANEKLKSELLTGEVEVVMIRHKRNNVVVIGDSIYKKAGKVQ